MSALTLSEAKTTLGLTGTANDAELQQVINEAESYLQERVGPLVQTSVTERLMSSGGGLTTHYPIGSITSATHVWSNLVLPTAQCEQVSKQTFTRQFGLGLIPGPWDVDYKAGSWATAPPALIRASRELTVHLWQLARNRQSRPGSAPMDAVDAYNLPRRVEQLIFPFLMNGAA